MAFATVEDVRDQTTIGEVSNLPTEKIEFYIERANSYLRRRTKKNYRDETDPDILSDLKRATVLLVEYHWLFDLPEVKESEMTGVESERIGSYSYNKGAKGGTGNEELESILDSLELKVDGFLHFSVSGPSRVTAKPYNPHAWVTDYED